MPFQKVLLAPQRFIIRLRVRSFAELVVKVAAAVPGLDICWLIKRKYLLCLILRQTVGGNEAIGIVSLVRIDLAAVGFSKLVLIGNLLVLKAETMCFRSGVSEADMLAVIVVYSSTSSKREFILVSTVHYHLPIPARSVDNFDGVDLFLVRAIVVPHIPIFRVFCDNL